VPPRQNHREYEILEIWRFCTTAHAVGVSCPLFFLM